jgi:hypothetical protein
METEQAKLPPPPHLISSFAAGFDAIANHVTVILLPILVDVFLWLGPHLQVKHIMLSLLKQTQSASAQLSVPIKNIPDPATVQQMYTDFFTRFNLFAGLRTFPVGSSSLMSTRLPAETPLGVPATYDLSSIFSIAGWVLLILVAGWLLGSFYFYFVSSAALTLPRRPFLPAIFQVLVLCAFWLTVVFLAGIPVLLIVSVISLVSPFLAQAFLFLLGMVALWLILPIFFSPHGIFAYQQNAIAAIRTSLRLIRYTLPTSGLFLLSILLIGQGLDYLWRTPPATSWWTLVGIAGHAFVSTALLAASFVYYRDVNVWLTAMFEQLKQRPVSVKI